MKKIGLSLSILFVLGFIIFKNKNSGQSYENKELGLILKSSFRKAEQTEVLKNIENQENPELLTYKISTQEFIKEMKADLSDEINHIELTRTITSDSFTKNELDQMYKMNAVIEETEELEF